MHALDSATGSTLWSYKITEGAKDQLSAIVPAPSMLFLANLNGALVALAA